MRRIESITTDDRLRLARGTVNALLIELACIVAGAEIWALCHAS